MKLFLDTAHLQAIEKAQETGLINGITTNPTHLGKEMGDISVILQKICKLMYPSDVSIEVTEKEPSLVYNQARKIASLAPNVAVKIPCLESYTSLIKKLIHEGIAINITLVFSAVQGLCMAKLGVKYVSPFIGRLEDIDENGIQLIKDLRIIFDNYNFETKILAASVRTIGHVHAAALYGADIATIPVPLFQKLLDHPLTEQGIKLFQEDWQKLGLKHFP